MSLLSNFAIDPSNHIEGYEYCAHIKKYLLQQADTCGKSSKELALATGYANIYKFEAHRKLWHRLGKPVPRKYLDAISVDINTLVTALKDDLVDFSIACMFPRFAERCIIRYMPGFYGCYSFGGIVPEKEAVELTKAHAAKIKCECCINYPGLLRLMVKPDGSVETGYYRPSMKVTKSRVVFGYDGASLGMMSVG